MRLFSQWQFVFSQSDEETVDEVAATLQRINQQQIKQVIPFADAGSATIEAGETYTVSQVGATSTRDRLLDLSVNGDCLVSITQDAAVKAIPLLGTVKLPARLTLTLAASVTAITIENREATADVAADWMYAEMTDITDRDYFPVV